MIVGLLSDTHDKLPAAKAAVQALLANGAQYLLHAGDIGGEQIIDLLAGTPSAFVWGNNDLRVTSLATYASDVGVTCLDAMGEVEIDGKKFILTHGDHDKTVRQILADQQHDYLITGHTHARHDRRVGRVRWINPGAMHRVGIRTVALLDTATDSLRTLTVNVK
jgi:putative phosphoesterase